MKSIDAKMIQDFIALKKNSSSLKDSTINRLLSLISKIYSDAIVWNYAKSNPVKGIKKFKENDQEMLYLTKDEVKLFLQNCGENFYPVASTAVYTGMRKGEICGLTWDNLNLERKIITIEKSMKGKTKSKKTRHIPINTNLLNILKQLNQNRHSGFVFTKNKEGEMYKGYFKDSMVSSLNRANIKKRLRFHDLRHTFAANFLMSGGKITALSRILGHSTIQMTMKYAHFSEEFIETEIDKLDYK